MDESDWIELYRREMPALYRAVARRVGGERMLAEDTAQEAWLRALDAWALSGPPLDPGAWLRTVAFNLLRNDFRRRGVEAAALESLQLNGEADPEPPSEAVEFHLRLQAGLARLPPEQAALLDGRYFEEHSLSELASALGITIRGAERRLHRARAALARILGNDPRLSDL